MFTINCLSCNPFLLILFVNLFFLYRTVCFIWLNNNCLNILHLIVTHCYTARINRLFSEVFFKRSLMYGNKQFARLSCKATAPPYIRFHLELARFKKTNNGLLCCSGQLSKRRSFFSNGFSCSWRCTLHTWVTIQIYISPASVSVCNWQKAEQFSEKPFLKFYASRFFCTCWRCKLQILVTNLHFSQQFQGSFPVYLFWSF